MTCIVENGFVPDPFPDSNNFKKDCILAPTLFMFATMLFSALSATDTGITVRYRCDVRFFDLRRLKARTKVLEALEQDFLFFAEDCSLAALKVPDLQEFASCLSTAAKAIGLTISLS